ncbi:DUF2637 domain-containing protein [Amycolatopsis sp. NPDC049691]|uniref:DUF2637 domain-containing protein n=1 Tax=Amycolatopsis sp. NPDC049691 TaxID=3155155 RepID=UPI00341EF3E4
MRRLKDWLAQDLALSIQCICTGLVALGAAYASYRHGQEFALRFGADGVTASIWPLLVDGLLTIATVELWKTHRSGRPAGRWVAWLAFVFGICLSLVANICSAPALSVLQVTVAACPPLVLLLSVELLNGALKQRSRETCSETRSCSARDVRSGSRDGGGQRDFQVGSADDHGLAAVMEDSERTVEDRMWEYYVNERACGRTPTGADLDRVAGTHNYGRRILRKWRSGQDRQIEGSTRSSAAGAVATSARAVTYAGPPS